VGGHKANEPKNGGTNQTARQKMLILEEQKQKKVKKAD